MQKPRAETAFCLILPFRQENMANTLWDSFDTLLLKAEQDFLCFNIQGAVDHWQKYYEITARTEYQKIIAEIKQNWREDLFRNIPYLTDLYKIYCDLRSALFNQKISRFTFDLYKKLLLKIYNERFRQNTISETTLESGVFAYLNGDNETAIKILGEVLKKDVASHQARVFLGAAYLALHHQREAIAALSQNLFLAADQLYEDDLYLSQFKMLFGKLHMNTAHKKEAAWLLTFESWFRHYLVFEADKPFFRLMQKKEANERILQVKYYKYERYRHFCRCLFLADYSRIHSPQNKRFIIEQENYMARLDEVLFNRYRRKRKEIKP